MSLILMALPPLGSRIVRTGWHEQSGIYLQNSIASFLLLMVTAGSNRDCCDDGRKHGSRFSLAHVCDTFMLDTTVPGIRPERFVS